MASEVILHASRAFPIIGREATTALVKCLVQGRSERRSLQLFSSRIAAYHEFLRREPEGTSYCSQLYVVLHFVEELVRPFRFATRETGDLDYPLLSWLVDEQESVNWDSFQRYLARIAGDRLQDLRQLCDHLEKATEQPSTSLWDTSLWDSSSLLADLAPSTVHGHSQDVEAYLAFVLKTRTYCSCQNETPHKDHRHLRRLALRWPDLTDEASEQNKIPFEILFSSPRRFCAEANCNSRECYHEADFLVFKSHLTIKKQDYQHTHPEIDIGHRQLCQELHRNHDFRLGFTVAKEASEGVKLLRNSEHSFPRRIAPMNFQTLAAVLDAEHAKLGPRQLITLAYLATISVYQYYNTEWMVNPWTSKEIHIVKERRFMNRGCKRQSYPYIAPSQWGSSAEGQTGETEEDPFLGICYPKIRALGIILLEIILHSRFPWEKVKCSGDEQEQVYRLLLENTQLWNSPQNLWHSEYLAVIWKCFETRTFLDLESVEARRSTILSQLIRPLERLYISGVLCRCPPLSSRQDVEVDHLQEDYPVTTDVFLTASREVRQAQTWIDDQFGHSGPTLRVIDKLISERKDIKIAVLDTGCNSKAGYIVANNRHYKNTVIWHDFVEEGNQGWVDEDDGIDERDSQHGTNIVTLLLKVLPKKSFKIDVCRIARKQKDLANSKDFIVKAIKHCGKPEQGINIVSMSFGFDDESKSIKAAIEDAVRDTDEQILFFAAANNEGSREEKFPASYSQRVISVRGTKTNDEFERLYSPDKAGSNSSQFLYGTLACDIPCGLPINETTRSGCSVATPILAATAALFLQFAYCTTKGTDDFPRIERLYKPEGMLKLFEEISSHPDAHNMRLVTPRCLFDLRDSARLTAIQRALDRLKPEAP